MRARLLVWSLGLLACGGEAGGRAPALAEPASGVGLYTFALPEGSAPRPPGLESAETRHAAAAEAFHAGDFAGAADGFLEAARLARAEPGSPYGPELEGARMAACRNAALAYGAAGRSDAARVRAAAVRATDPGCAAALEALSPIP